MLCYARARIHTKLPLDYVSLFSVSPHSFHRISWKSHFQSLLLTLQACPRLTCCFLLSHPSLHNYFNKLLTVSYLLNPLGIFSYLTGLPFDFHLCYTCCLSSNSLYLWLLRHHTVQVRLILLPFLSLLRTHRFLLLWNFIAPHFCDSITVILIFWIIIFSLGSDCYCNTLGIFKWMSFSIITWNFQN